MSLEKTMQAYATLIETLTAAVRSAAKAGIEKGDIQSALETVTGLVENAEEE